MRAHSSAGPRLVASPLLGHINSHLALGFKISIIGKVAFAVKTELKSIGRNTILFISIKMLGS